MNAPVLWLAAFLVLAAASTFGALLMALLVNNRREDEWAEMRRREANVIRLRHDRLAQSMDVERRRSS